MIESFSRRGYTH